VPSLSSLGLDVNPSKEPAQYPGAAAGESCLAIGSWLYPLVPQPTVGFAEWPLDVDGGPLRYKTAGRPTQTLAAALAIAGAPALADRFPVIAVGSNAAPAQLLHKLSSEDRVSLVVPMTLANVEAIGIAHSAHISKAGYCPYIPVADKQAIEQLSILWLDKSQLDRVTETEPNYQAVTSGRDSPPALLPSGERIDVFSMYRGRWGALRYTTTDDHRVEATTQERVFNLLSSHAWFRSLVPECEDGPLYAMRSLGSDEQRRTEVREQMARHGLATSDGLNRLDSFAPQPYSEAVSAR